MKELTRKLEQWLGVSPQLEHPQLEHDAAIFSAELLLAQIDGDFELARVVAESGLQSLPGYAERVARSAAARDWDTLQGIAHTLKTLLMQLGAPQIAERFQRCREAIRAGRPPDEVEMAALQEVLHRLMAALEAWLRENPD